MRSIALLDRDGTINVKAREDEYITAPTEVRLLPGTGAAIRELNQANVPVAVVTNQRGIARGLMRECHLRAVNRRLAELLAIEGASIDLWLHCPHENASCACRKPAPGMLLEALERLNADPAMSVMIGDSVSDVAAGQAADVPAILLVTQESAAVTPGTAKADSLGQAVSMWLRGSPHVGHGASTGPGHPAGRAAAGDAVT